MSKWDSTHQSLLECENRMSNRPEQAHILCQWGGFQLNDCMTSSYVLLRSVKEELTLLKHCTVCSQSTLADTIWIRGCRLPGETMLRRTTVQGSSGRKGAKKNKQKKWNAITFLILNGNTICPSLCLFPHLFFCLRTLVFTFISTLLGSRGGLNGDIVASWEQHPDAVWVCKAELQHQWFCCQGEDYSSGNLLINVGAWMLHDDGKYHYSTTDTSRGSKGACIVVV